MNKNSTLLTKCKFQVTKATSWLVSGIRFYLGLYRVVSPRYTLLSFNKVIIISIFTLLFTNRALADYTVPLGSTIDASTITAQTGVLTIKGTLKVSSNVFLSGFTSVIVSGPAGQIYWTANKDLSFNSGVTLDINNPGTTGGLQPTGGNVAKTLTIGNTTMAVSSNNSNDAVFSFAELNLAGGIPEFTLTSSQASPAIICYGTAITATITPTDNIVSVQCIWSIDNNASISPASAYSFTTAQTATITPINSAIPKTYTITCKIYRSSSCGDHGGDYEYSGDWNNWWDNALLTSKTISVTVNPIPKVSAIAGGSSTACVNASTPAFTDATAGGTWSITNGTGTATITAAGVVTGITPGTVTIVYTFNNGNCTNTATKSLTVKALPVVAAIGGGATTICVNANTPAFTDVTAGGTWSITNGTGTATITAGGVVTGLTSGTVTVVYTFNNGTCANTATKLLTINALPVVAPIGGGATVVCFNTNTAAFTDATAGGTWSITNGTGIASITAGGIVTGITPGTVTVVYTFNNGACTNAATKSLTVNALPVVAAIGGATTVCVNANTPAFTDATAGGTWSITNGTGTASITAGGVVTGLTPGTVTIVYTFNNGNCTNTATKSLTVNALPVVAPIGGGATAVCFNTNTPAFTDATAGGTWSITNGTGIASITAGGVVTGITPGTVTVVYTLNNGTCSNTATKSLTVNALPVVSSIGGGAATVCVNASTPAFTDATAGGTWSITNGTGTASITAAGVVTGITPGTITIVYTFNNGNCTNTATKSLTVIALPVVAAVGNGATTVCVNANTPAFTDATAGGSWSITNGTGTATITAGGVVTGLTSGTVTVVYTFNNGTCANTATKLLTINALPVVAPVGGGATAVCVSTNTPAFTDATAGGTWSITNGTGTAIITAGGVVTGLTPGTVTVVYTFNNGTCTNTATKSLTVNALPLVASIGGSTTVCVNANTPAFTDATAGGTWSITNGTGTASITAGGVVTGLTPGTVTVVYTFNNGTCTNTATKSLTVNPLPVVAPIGGGATTVCANANTPAFTDATAGGTWSITNGTGTATITAGGVVTGLTSGTVAVVYTFNNGTCVNSATTSLTVNALPLVAAIGGGATTVCVSTNTPAFTDATAGGTWSITNGTGSASITAAGVVTGLTPGTVTVVYTFNNGACTNTATTSLTVNALPVVATIGDGATAVCVNTDTPAFTDATAGGTWSISNGTGTASITAGEVVTGLTPGTVTVVYTFNNGTCTNTAATSLTINALPVVAAINGGATTVCVSTDTPAFTNATAGGTWSITNGTGTAIITASGVVTGLTPGTVTVVYTFNNGTCTNTAATSLTVNALPVVAPINDGATTVCVNTNTRPLQMQQQAEPGQ